MAKATANCTCKTCGCKFIKTEYKCNRKEADNWTNWAEYYYDECPKCFKERKETENAEVATNYNLPELTAVSDKQKNYAELMRNRYIAENKENIDKIQKVIVRSTSQEYIDACAKQGVDPQQHFSEFVKRPSIKKVYACLTETNAGALLDVLLN